MMPQPKNQTLTPVTDQVFHGGTVNLDGKAFNRCTFKSCILEIGATAPFNANESVQFHDCQWTFVGPARLTVEIIAAINMMPGMQDTFEQIISHMRGKGLAAQKPPASA
jgi:hypothetical protein